MVSHGFNTKDIFGYRQECGACVAILNTLANLHTTTEHDPSGLVRWKSQRLQGK